MKKVTLGEKFLNQYGDFPDHMNAIGMFVYLRTYSRYLPQEGRRETWKETCKRSVEYNVDLMRKHAEKTELPIAYKELEKEAEEWFDSMFNLQQFLSGRTLWVGGAENSVADKFPLANFNCSFTTIEKWEDLADHFYLLLVGTGVGFKHTFKMADNIAPVRDNVTITHKPYEDYYSQGIRIAETKMFDQKVGNAIIYIGDSKEGWVEALRIYFKILSEKEFEHITEIQFIYDYIRPKGTKLKTFGGTASGHESMQDMFTNIDRTIKNQIDPTLAPPKRLYEFKDLNEFPTKTPYVKLRPIHILDFGNFLGHNVVVGGKQ